MNCWRGKKGGRVTVDRICGKPRFTKDKKSKVEPGRFIQPGDPDWEEFLATFPKAAQRRIEERMNPNGA